MNINKLGEVENGIRTYQYIANKLYKDKSIGIGWTDGETIHLDIIFKLGLHEKDGEFQTGIKQDNLFIGVIGWGCYGFIPNTIKDGSYVSIKLGLGNTSLGDKINELVNGIIIELNKIKKEN